MITKPPRQAGEKPCEGTGVRVLYTDVVSYSQYTDCYRRTERHHASEQEVITTMGKLKAQVQKYALSDVSLIVDCGFYFPMLQSPVSVAKQGRGESVVLHTLNGQPLAPTQATHVMRFLGLAHKAGGGMLSLVGKSYARTPCIPLLAYQFDEQECQA